MYVLQATMHDDDDAASIVLDTGAVCSSAGNAGEDSPKLKFPTCVGYPPEMAHLQIKPGETWKGQYTVGAEALRKKSSSMLKWPIEQGVIKDWDAMEKVWHHAFAELMVTPAEEYGGVLLGDAITNPKDGRERTTHIMFERFQLPSFYTAPLPILAMYAAGKTNGVTVDAGEHFVHVVPVLEGYPVLYATQKLGLAGLHVSEAVAKALARLGVTADEAAARKVKEEVCHVSMNYAAESANLGTSKKDYTMPDGTKVALGAEQVQPYEIMFAPEQHGYDHRGLQHVIYKVVMDCDYDQRNELWNNIVMVGGTSLAKNIVPRLQKELGNLAPKSSQVNITAPSERHYYSWLGGSILASLNTFNQMWITKEEYDESGPCIVHRKCI